MGAVSVFTIGNYHCQLLLFKFFSWRRYIEIHWNTLKSKNQQKSVKIELYLGLSTGVRSARPPLYDTFLENKIYQNRIIFDWFMDVWSCLGVPMIRQYQDVLLTGFNFFMVQTTDQITDDENQFSQPYCEVLSTLSACSTIRNRQGCTYIRSRFFTLKTRVVSYISACTTIYGGIR